MKKPEHNKAIERCINCKHFLRDCSDSINENCLQCVSNEMNFEPKEELK